MVLTNNITAMVEQSISFLAIHKIVITPSGRTETPTILRISQCATRENAVVYLMKEYSAWNGSWGVDSRDQFEKQYYGVEALLSEKDAVRENCDEMSYHVYAILQIPDARNYELDLESPPFADAHRYVPSDD